MDKNENSDTDQGDKISGKRDFSKINYADFYSRATASVIDTGIILAFILIFLVLGIDPAAGIIILFSVFITMETSDWQATPGKKVCGLIVTDLSDQKISLGKSLIRNFPKLVMFVFFSSQWGFLISMLVMLAFFVSVFSKEKQGLHDKLARTVVLQLQSTSVRTDKQKKRLRLIISSGFIFLVLIVCIVISIPQFLAEQERLKNEVMKNRR